MPTSLLAVTGMSPAVITETLYGIDKKGEEWPTNITIITTKRGRNKMIADLIEADEIGKLCQSLGKENINFTQDDILIVTNDKGDPVDDARSSEDHEALANFIVSRVKDYTSDDNTRIHASIAGGRKTMTFYMGYAMSLFARRDDKLSHVLVSEGYEGLPGFFYPTKHQQILETRDGEKLDASQAEVTLADIPFIRQRHLLPDIVKTFDGEVDFRFIVGLINLGEAPEHIRMKIYRHAMKIRIYSEEEPELFVDVGGFNPLHWAFFLLLTEDSAQSDSQSRGGYNRPPAKQAPDLGLAIDIIYTLVETQGIKRNVLKSNSDLAQLIHEVKAHPLTENFSRLDESLNSIKDGMTADQFSTYLNKIKERFKSKLPSNLVDNIQPVGCFDPESGEALEDAVHKTYKGAGFGIPLPNPAKQIEWPDE